MADAPPLGARRPRRDRRRGPRRSRRRGARRADGDRPRAADAAVTRRDGHRHLPEGSAMP